MKIKRAFLMILPLAACASAQQVTQLPQWKGAPLSAAVHSLGAPQQKVRQSDFEEIYVWTHKKTWRTYMAGQGSGSGPEIGIVGKNIVSHNTTRPFAPQTYSWECRLSVSTDKGRIIDARYWGDPPACAYFRDKMKP